jgi:hypothetical protein
VSRRLTYEEIQIVIDIERQDVEVHNPMGLSEGEIKAFLDIVREEVSSWSLDEYYAYLRHEGKRMLARGV